MTIPLGNGGGCGPPDEIVAALADARRAWMRARAAFVRYHTQTPRGHAGSTRADAARAWLSALADVAEANQRATLLFRQRIDRGKQ